MSDTFLHGVETITSPVLSLVNTIKTGVIGLIGTAATGDTDTLILCATEKDDVQFGTTGTIPEALTIIRNITRKTGATVLVVSIGTGTPTPEAADFVGAVDAGTGARSGLKCFDAAVTKFGFNAKIFIAPRFSSVGGVKTALETVAEKFKGYAYLEAPTGLTVTEAIALRTTGALWATMSERSKYLYPNPLDAAGTERPFSAYSAALRAKLDATSELEGGGFWVSNSNNAIDGISGLSVEISASVNDVNSESNLLNAAGITTIFNMYGADFREWGNRNASFPTETGIGTFESTTRAQDLIDDSIELACLRTFTDKNITQANIDLAVQMVNTYYNSLIKRGAVLEGSKCLYEASKNSDAEIADGHVVFSKIQTTPTPAERITFDKTIDINLLANIQ